MRRLLKLAFYLALFAGGLWFGYATFRDYSLLMIEAVDEDAPAERRERAVIETKSQKAARAGDTADQSGGLERIVGEEEEFRGLRANRKITRHYLHLLGNGIGFALCLTVLGFVLAHDLGDVLRFGFGKEIQYVDDASARRESYERAEYLILKGKNLEAVELLRQIVRGDPKNWHAQLRIAEVYDKELKNWPVAADEYEATLQMEMPPEKWGWTAIRVCNLYTGKLGETHRALTILRQLAKDLPQTQAGQKAVKRLAMVDAARR